VAKSGAGTLDINGPLGTGGVAVSASTGTTRFHTSQTLAALTIGAGANVVFSSGPPPAPLAFGPVPEPGTLGLLLVGTLGVLNRRRRAGV
jgi:hypothetical protein